MHASVVPLNKSRTDRPRREKRAERACGAARGWGRHSKSTDWLRASIGPRRSHLAWVNPVAQRIGRHATTQRCSRPMPVCECNGHVSPHRDDGGQSHAHETAPLQIWAAFATSQAVFSTARGHGDAKAGIGGDEDGLRALVCSPETARSRAIQSGSSSHRITRILEGPAIMVNADLAEHAALGCSNKAFAGTCDFIDGCDGVCRKASAATALRPPMR